MGASCCKKVGVSYMVINDSGERVDVDDSRVSLNSDARGRDLQPDHEGDSPGKGVVQCVWRRTCLALLVSCILLAGLITILLFLVIIPSVAHSAGNTAVIIQQHTGIFGITNDSIGMNATLQITNVGAFHVHIDSARAVVHNRYGPLGEMQLPALTLHGTNGLTFQQIGTLRIYEESLEWFKNDVKSLLHGHDAEWHLVSKPQVKIDFLGSEVSLHLKNNMTLSLSGATLSDTTAKNMTVVDTDSEHIYATAAMEFSTSSQMVIDVQDVYFAMHDFDTNIQMGYAYVEEFALRPGYNSLRGAQTVVERTPENAPLLGPFFSTYISGVNQKVRLVGPYNRTRNTVLDGCVNSTGIVVGSTAGQIGVAGLQTQESSLGWFLNTTRGHHDSVSGAYGTFFNPLPLNLRLVKMSAAMELLAPIEYNVTWKFGPRTWFYQCPKTIKIAQLIGGHGIYENDPKKTYVDIPPSGYSSQMVRGFPLPGQSLSNDTICNKAVGYDCCFASAMVAAICKENPQLFNDIHNELTTSYFATSLDANITATIGDPITGFNMSLHFKQDWFPVFVGYGMYSGFQVWGANGKDIPKAVFHYPSCADLSIAGIQIPPTVSPTPKPVRHLPTLKPIQPPPPFHRPTLKPKPTTATPTMTTAAPVPTTAEPSQSPTMKPTRKHPPPP